jgi:hypothetical protein
MSLRVRRPLGLLLAAAAAVLLALAPAIGARADSPGLVTPAHVPYYVVPLETSTQGLDELGLYNLAQTVLGNGNDYTQIVTLNQGRPQAAGGALANANQLSAGWYLVLPCTASGSFLGVQVQWNPPPADVPPAKAGETCPANVGPTDTPVPAAAAGSPVASAAAAAPGSQASASTGAAAPAHASGKSSSSTPLWLWIVFVVVGVALAVLVIVWERRRNRRRDGRDKGAAGPARPKIPMTRLRRRRKLPDVLLAMLADPGTVDAAHEAFDAVGRTESWWPYAVAVSPQEATVWLAGTDLPEPPEPWHPVDGDERAWTASRAELAQQDEAGADTQQADTQQADAEQGAASQGTDSGRAEGSGAHADSDAAAGFEGAPVVLGVLDDTVVVLDVAQAHGVLVIGGDTRRAEALRDSLHAQLQDGEILLGAADGVPAGGRSHWALDVDAAGAITVHGREVEFAAIPATPPAVQIPVPVLPPKPEPKPVVMAAAPARPALQQAQPQPQEQPQPQPQPQQQRLATQTEIRIPVEPQVIPPELAMTSPHLRIIAISSAGVEVDPNPVRASAPDPVRPQQATSWPTESDSAGVEREAAQPEPEPAEDPDDIWGNRAVSSADD